MSAANAAAATAPEAAPKGKKKLLLLIVAVLVLALLGVGAFFMLKKHNTDADADGDEPAKVQTAKPVKHGPVVPPIFVPLEPFVVNLADKDAERYAQIGITLEVADQASADQLKAYMPAIRNGILMVLSHKTSTELLQREGKEQLAREIMRESVQPLGIELDDEDDDSADTQKATDSKDAAAKPAAATAKKKRKRHLTPVEESPVRHVHFANFIIQ